uniref:Uncharacterized protein n=1 Tax=Tetranychus urticae TaxID=32264 RepID=T1JXP1_TETUR
MGLQSCIRLWLIYSPVDSLMVKSWLKLNYGSTVLW